MVTKSIPKKRKSDPNHKSYPSYKGRMTMHLSDDDRERLEWLKAARGAMSWAEVLRALIREEMGRRSPVNPPVKSKMIR